MVEYVTTKLSISGHLARKVLGRHRLTQRKALSRLDDEAARESGPLRLETLAIDGTKLDANAFMNRFVR